MRLLRWTLNLALLGGALVAAACLLLLTRDTQVPPVAAPSSEDVQLARGTLKTLRDTGVAPGETTPIPLSAAEIDAVMALGARLLPGLRGTVSLEEGAIALQGALPVLDGRGWLEAEARIEDFSGGLRIAALRLGRLDVPPDAARDLAVFLANRSLGDEAGDRLLAAFPAMAASPEGVVLTRAHSGREADQAPLAQDVARRAVQAMGGDVPSGPEVAARLEAIEAGFADGTLTGQGSFLPHLRFALDLAHERVAAGDIAREYTAAILALAHACGTPLVAAILPEGEVIERPRRGVADCGGAALHGRVDLRRHFVTAAALRALSNRGVAVSIGEFKELSDMGFERGAFDFTDIAANNSGIRLSDRLMSAPASEWPALLDAIASEEDVIVSLDGIPGRLPRAEFERRFGGLDSPDYAEMLAQIEARIDTLPIHAGPIHAGTR
jgi:hypothetical protein